MNGTVPEGSKLVNCDRETKSLVCSSTGKCECAASDKKTMYDPGKVISIFKDKNI